MQLKPVQPSPELLHTMQSSPVNEIAADRMLADLQYDEAYPVYDYNSRDSYLKEDGTNRLSPDPRVQLDQKTSRSFPFRCWGRLFVMFRKNGTEEYLEGIATGVLVGPNHVLTAGHNLFRKGYTVSWLTFDPGVNHILNQNQDDTNPPFGRASGNNFWVHPEYKKADMGNPAPTPAEQQVVNANLIDYDIALIWIDKNFEKNVGWMRVADLDKDPLKTRRVGTHGYPVDKDFSQMKMFGAETQVSMDVTDKHFLYKYHSRSGHSGAGIWTHIDFPKEEGPYIVGINHGSTMDSSGHYLDEAFAAKINKEIKDYVLWAIKKDVIA